MAGSGQSCFGFTNLPGTCSAVSGYSTYSGNTRLMTVDTTTPGIYNAVYKVTATGGHTVTKTIAITVDSFCDHAGITFNQPSPLQAVSQLIEFI